MDFTGLAVYAMALAIAAASPGPGIAALVARVLGRGARGAVAFTAGITLGDLIWLTTAILGLAAVAQAFQGIFAAIKYAGAAYLLYLAWKLWTSPAELDGVEMDARSESPAKLFAAGLSLTLGNPKPMVFYLALLPTILDLSQVTIGGYVELIAVTVAVLVVVLAGYIVLAVRARRLFTSPSAVRRINRTAGAVMAGAAAAIAAR